MSTRRQTPGTGFVSSATMMMTEIYCYVEDNHQERDEETAAGVIVDDEVRMSRNRRLNEETTINPIMVGIDSNANH